MPDTTSSLRVKRERKQEAGTQKICGRETFSNFLVQNRTESHVPQRADAHKHLRGVDGDLPGSRRGDASSDGADFDAITRDSERKILPPGRRPPAAAKIFRNFRSAIR